MELFKLFGSVLVDTSKAEKSLSNVDKKGKSTGTSMASSFGKMAKSALAFGAVLGLGLGLKDMITKATESQKKLAQMDAVLKSTGGAAGMSKDALLKLAEAQGKVTTFSKGTTIAGENLLLTFTSIGKKTFPDTIKAAQNMSTAMGTDLNSSVMTLGKALNDPVAGVTKLTKQGVTFTAQQKEQIKTMAKSGNTAGAQAIMLKELQKEFGGSAEAAGKTFGGQLAILKNQMAGVSTSLGTTLLPYIMRFISAIVKYMPTIQSVIKRVLGVVVPLFKGLGDGIKSIIDVFMNLSSGTKKTIGAIAAVAVAFGIGITIFNNAKLAIAGIKLALAGLTWPMVLIAAGIALLTAAFTNNWGGIRTKTLEFVNFMKPIIINAFNAVVAWFKLHWPQIKSLFELTMQGIKLAYNIYLKPVLIIMIAALKSVVNWVRVNWPTIKAVITTVLNGVKIVITSILNYIKNFWNTWGNSIKIYVSTVFNLIRIIISTAINVIKNVLNAVMQVIKGNWSGAWSSMVAAAKSLFGGIKSVISTILSGIGKLFVEFVKVAIGYGKGIIGGIIDGIKTKAKELAKGVGDIISAVKLAFTKGFGIASPAKWFIWAGSHMMGGLIKGMTGSNVKKFAMNLVESIKEQFGGLGGAVSGDLSGWLTEAMAITGTPMDQYGAVMQMIMSESGGNPNAINLTDSNAKAGHPSRGLLQTIPTTFEQWRNKSLPDNIVNPLANLVAGLNYIKGTYGSAFNTPGIKSMAGGGKYKGYRIGSRYVPYDQVTTVHEGEMITPKSENPYVNSGGRITPNNGISQVLNIYSPTALSPSQIARENKKVLQELALNF